MAEMTTTTVQAAPIPDDDDSYLKSVPDYITALAQWVELRVVMRFATMSEFTSKIPSPVNGMVFWVEADNALYLYADGVVRVWPTQPQFIVGSGAPTGPMESGAIYFEMDS